MSNEAPAYKFENRTLEWLWLYAALSLDLLWIQFFFLSHNFYGVLQVYV